VAEGLGLSLAGCRVSRKTDRQTILYSSLDQISISFQPKAKFCLT